MLSADFDYLMLLDVDVILLCRRPELTCEENGKKDVKQIKPFFSCFSNDCPSLGGWPPLSPPLEHSCAPAPRFFNFPPPRSRRKRTYSAVWRGRGVRTFSETTHYNSRNKVLNLPSDKPPRQTQYRVKTTPHVLSDNIIVTKEQNNLDSITLMKFLQ